MLAYFLTMKEHKKALNLLSLSGLQDQEDGISGCPPLHTHLCVWSLCRWLSRGCLMESSCKYSKSEFVIRKKALIEKSGLRHLSNLLNSLGTSTKVCLATIQCS